MSMEIKKDIKLNSFGFKLLIFFICIAIIHITLFIFTETFNNKKNIPVWEQGLDGLYFTTTTLATIGYGDLTPSTPVGKIIVIIEQLVLIYLSIDELSYYLNS